MTYKRKDCFELKEIAGDSVVVARGSAAIDFNGILVLNEACVVLWNGLQDSATAEALADQLVSVFGIDKETALKDTQICLDKMLEHGLLETA